MKSILIADEVYKIISNDAKRRKLTVEELVQVVLKREYKIK
jgi:hypothetical protein